MLRLKQFGLIIVVVNALWIIMELCFIGIGIHEIHVSKKELDDGEQSDSTFLSYLTLYIGYFIVACGTTCMIVDVFANISLYFHIRKEPFCTGLLFYIITTTIITIISIPSIIVIDFYGYQAFGYTKKDCTPTWHEINFPQYNRPRRCYPAKIRITLLCFWSLKLVYNVVVVVFAVFERKRGRLEEQRAANANGISELENNAEKQYLETSEDNKVEK